MKSASGFFINNDLTTGVDTVHKHECPKVSTLIGGGYYDSTTELADAIADWSVGLGKQILVACPECLPDTMIVS